MEITVIEEAPTLQVSAPAVQVTVENGVTVLEVTEQPVRLTLTETRPTIEIADAGVQGPPGPQGAQGPAGDETGMGFVHHQSFPVTTLQINHGFLFQPAGVVCLATGDPFPLLGVGISYPLTGFIELDFGSPFTGDVYLS